MLPTDHHRSAAWVVSPAVTAMPVKVSVTSAVRHQYLFGGVEAVQVGGGWAHWSMRPAAMLLPCLWWGGRGRAVVSTAQAPYELPG
ncbi:hypothetical protein TPAU25S_00912 [Tsukamurella paurometabola]